MPPPEISCVDTPPTIDGVFDILEWGSTPLFQFQPENNGSRLGAGLFCARCNPFVPGFSD
jgi:hypothetical protein